MAEDEEDGRQEKQGEGNGDYIPFMAGYKEVVINDEAVSYSYSY